MRNINYFGDINIEYGGTYYDPETLDAVRVTPCSDAGAADNCYWVEELTIIIPQDTASVLACAGYTQEQIAEHPNLLIEACLCYGSYDQHSCVVVQIGYKQSEYGEPIKADVIKRANASLRKYALSIL